MPGRRRARPATSAEAIDDAFGSLDELKQAVNDAGVKRFGSGWTWLVHDGTGARGLLDANQDSPLMRRPTCRSSASTSGSTPTT